MEDFFQVGIITSTHGLKGEVKVFPTTDDSKRFKALKKVIIDGKKERLEVKIQSVRFFKNMVILKFEGYDTINEVEKFRQSPLLVERKDAVPLKKDEYFISDMIGMRVVSDEDEELGILKDVLQTGANDVYIIKNDHGGELLLPAIKECILSVNIEEAVMLVHVMDGLR